MNTFWHDPSQHFVRKQEPHLFGCTVVITAKFKDRFSTWRFLALYSGNRKIVHIKARTIVSSDMQHDIQEPNWLMGLQVLYMFIVSDLLVNIHTHCNLFCIPVYILFSYVIKNVIYFGLISDKRWLSSGSSKLKTMQVRHFKHRILVFTSTPELELYWYWGIHPIQDVSSNF